MTRTAPGRAHCGRLSRVVLGCPGRWDRSGMSPTCDDDSREGSGRVARGPSRAARGPPLSGQSGVPDGETVPGCARLVTGPLGARSCGCCTENQRTGTTEHCQRARCHQRPRRERHHRHRPLSSTRCRSSNSRQPSASRRPASSSVCSAVAAICSSRSRTTRHCSSYTLLTAPGGRWCRSGRYPPPWWRRRR